MKTIKKNVIPLVLGIVIGLAVSYFFLNKGDDGTNYINTKYAIHTTNFVSTRESAVWVDHYRHMWDKMMDSLHVTPRHKYGLPLQFFTVRSQDLLCAMGIDTAWQYKTAYPYVRISIGFSDSLKQLKAFVQPVDSVDLLKGNAGHALFFNKKGAIVDSHGNLIGRDGHIISKKPENNQDSLFVADLNTPCPSTCGN